MIVQVAEEVDAGEWDERAVRAGGSVFHTTAWAEYRRAGSRRQPLYVSWIDDDGRRAAIGVAIADSPFGTRAGMFVSRVRFDSPPVAIGERCDFVEPVIEWARCQPGVIEVKFGSFDMRVGWGDSPPKRDERIEFVLDPTEDADALTRMRKGTRSSIRRAERLGVRVRHGSTLEDLLVFADLFHSAVERLARTKSVRPDREQSASLAKRLQILVEAGAGRLYLAELDGMPVAGCFFASFGMTAYYLLNGSIERGREVGGTPLALYAAIGDFAARGCARLNLGGVSAQAAQPDSADHGLYQFKHGIGAEPVVCIGGTAVIRPLRHAFLDVALRTRAALR